MAITNENQIIDTVTISNGCSIIEGAAKDFTTCAKKVLEASQICTSEALAVEGKSMQPTLEELANSIGTIQGNIEYFVSQIRNVAMTVQTTQLSELTEYKMSKLQNNDITNNTY